MLKRLHRLQVRRKDRPALHDITGRGRGKWHSAATLERYRDARAARNRTAAASRRANWRH